MKKYLSYFISNPQQNTTFALNLYSSSTGEDEFVLHKNSVNKKKYTFRRGILFTFDILFSANVRTERKPKS